MVEEPSHLKQLFLNHMCKIGLNRIHSFNIVIEIRDPYFIFIFSSLVSPVEKPPWGAEQN
jgi:hypothetical protein